MRHGEKQDRTLGSLMGMAIGDALGMPVSGWPRRRIAERYGEVDAYFPRVFSDGTEIKAGEFTDESETVLCIVESLTTNNGRLDPDNIGARMLHLAHGEAKRWMGAETLASLERLTDSLEFRVPLDEDGPATADVAARGIAIGLLHGVGAFDASQLNADAESVARLTHGSPAVIAATTAVAFACNLAVRGEVEPQEWCGAVAEFVGGGGTASALRQMAPLANAGAITDAAGDGEDAASVVASAVAYAAIAPDFQGAVVAAVNAGGAADARGAIAGAIAGARHGIAGVPQNLIDEMEGRIYVSLAAPWFYRTALRRAGLVLDLRPRS
jgi:ADP-ribosylglycohydrolase